MMDRRTCIRDGEIVCVDDLCHGTDRTLCGLEFGLDFGVEEFDGDLWEDE